MSRRMLRKPAHWAQRLSSGTSYGIETLEGRQLLSLTVPNAPYALVATPVSSSEIDLTWHDNNNGAPIDHYNLVIQGNVVSLPSTATSYQATGIQPSTTLGFLLTAENAAGSSSQLGPVAATTLTSSPTPTPTPTPTGYFISGTVFGDTNGNGAQDNGEAGLAGQQVYLDLMGLGHLVADDPTTLSDASGHYSFGSLYPNKNYIVRITMPSGATLTEPPLVYGGFYWVPAGSGPAAGKDFGFLGVNPTPNPTPIPTFTVADLGGNVLPFGINASGQIVGALGATIGIDSAAFRTSQPNSPPNYNTDKLVGNAAYAINASGQTVGITHYFTEQSQIGPLSPFDGFRTTANGIANTPGEIFTASNAVLDPTAINASGEVAAYKPSFADDIIPVPYRIPANQGFNATSDALLPANPFPIGTANGINDSGQVTGSAGFQTNVAYRTAPEAMYNPATDNLGTLGGSYSEGLAINNAGQVVGEAPLANGDVHAFRTGAQAVINPATDDLGTLGGNFAKALAINSSGAVVGQSKTVGGALHAFYATPGGKAVDLNTLVPANAGWVFTTATAINDSGHIVGQGMLYGFAHGFELTIAP